jgi:transcriptional regulator with XRE-family HTH domain
MLRVCHLKEVGMDDLAQLFGRLLAAHRRQKGLTQSQLAEHAQLSQEMITKLEAGLTGASFKAIERLADALEINPGALFSPEVGPRRRQLDQLVARLAALDEDDAEWAVRLIEVGLSRRP